MDFEGTKIVYFNTVFLHFLEYLSSEIILRLSDLLYRPLFVSEVETLAMKKVWRAH